MGEYKKAEKLKNYTLPLGEVRLEKIKAIATRMELASIAEAMRVLIDEKARRLRITIPEESEEQEAEKKPESGS